MRGFLQRCEVRLSTIHRVGQALLGGSALVLLLPLFVRDGFPKMTTLLISSYDADQSWIVICGIGAAAAVSVVLPVVAIYLLVGDLLGFYFTSNTFGASGAGDRASRLRQTPFGHCRHRAAYRLLRISWIRFSERKRVRFRER